YTSFDNWDGISSFSMFDKFYGSDKEISTQVVAEETEVVCEFLIQQKLLVLQDMAGQ
ncbi:hypothetical protein BT96DRAFT_806596, partial [Gymnopus androsaceus JB14]